MVCLKINITQLEQIVEEREKKSIVQSLLTKVTYVYHSFLNKKTFMQSQLLTESFISFPSAKLWTAP